MSVQLLLLMLLAVEAEGKNLVSCGNHDATDCSGCPRGRGAGWCNGECAWCHGTMKCYSKGVDCAEQVEKERKEKESGELKTKLDKVVGEMAKIAKVLTNHISLMKSEIGLAAVMSHEMKQLMAKMAGMESKVTGIESKVTGIESKVDGAWGQWNDYGTCSQTCGGGIKTRTRLCNKPPPRNGGSTCQGKDTDTAKCNVKGCKGYTKVLIGAKTRIRKNNLVATLKSFGPEYKVILEFFPNGRTTGWQEVIDSTAAGKRYLASVYYNGWDKRLLVYAHVNGRIYTTIATPIVMNAWHRVVATQKKEGGTYYYTVVVDSKQIKRIVNRTPIKYSGVKMYANGPSYHTQPGFIRKLEVQSEG